MMLLPKDVGPFTLVRKLGTGAVAESYVGTLHDGESRQVVVRRVLPYILRDAPRLASTEARVRDLMGVRHPFLVQVLDWVESGPERFIVEGYVDGVDLDRVLAWCRANGTPLPHNVFLNLATQICNGLEALHGRPGRGTGADNVLHLGLRPGAVLVTRDGKVVLGGYGLTRSPTALSHGGVSSPVPTRMEYLSPEQTQPDQRLTPSSDVFALGAMLYELLTLEPLFRSDSNLQTINRIRKAEVTTQLLRVKELMPGLDKVLYRALSTNPRHRYQRAFVLREDLRGLMAGYSFANIVEDTQAFLAPLVSELPEQAPTEAAAPPPPVVPTHSVTVERPVQEEVLLSLDADEGAEDGGAPDGEAEGSGSDATVIAAAAAAGLAVRAVAAEAGADGDTEHEPGPTLDRSTAVTVDEDDLPDADEERAAAGGSDEDEDLAQAAVVAGPGHAAPPVVPSPVLATPPPEDEFSDEVATRIERSPASTAALAADALRAQLDVDGPPPVDELPSAAPLRDADEDLADRSTLPLPPGASGLEDDTEAAAEAHKAMAAGSTTRAFLSREDLATAAPPAPAAPDSTLAFLRGGADPGDAAPPPVAPDPASSGIGARLAPPPPVVPGIATPRPAAAAPPPLPPAVPRPPTPTLAPSATVVPATAPPVPVVPAATPVAPATTAPAAPAAGRPALGGIAAKAPPPQAEPPPPPVDEDEELPPRRSGNGLVIGVAALVAGLVLVCGVGGFALSRLAGKASEQAGEAALAALDEAEAEATAAPVAAAEPAEGAPTEGAPTEAAPSEEAPSEEAPSEEAPTEEPGARAVAAAPSAAAAQPDRREAEPSWDEPARTSQPATAARTSGGSTSSGSASSGSASSGRASGSASSGRSSADDRGDALADLSLGDEPSVEEQRVQATELERYAAPASEGRLSSSDVMALEMVAADDPAYTRSRALLLMNAQRDGDEGAAKRYLDQLMRLPENRYNPVYLSDLGRHYVNARQYDKALEQAQLAERYWARLPPELVFTKKAEIYETQAAAWQGRFYQSGDDLEMLDQAIRHWQKYRDHVQTKSRADLARRAETELTKLEDIRSRLQ